MISDFTEIYLNMNLTDIKQNNEHVQNDKVAYDEINLRELFTIIWRGKWTVILITFLFTLVSIVYAVKQPDIYRSEVLLAPSSESSDMKIPGQLGGLAALAGVNVGGAGEKVTLALEIIKSRKFISYFIEQHDLLVPLMASVDWGRANNELIIDQDLFDTTSGKWVREVKAPYKVKPSLLEAHEKFIELMTISKNKDSGMVTLSFEHYSPYLAKVIVELLVQGINNEIRQRELREAQSSIDYLTKQLSETSIADVKSMLFSLIEDQTKTVMLANVRDEYIFKTVDPAVVAEKKLRPSRMIWVLMAGISGFLLSALIVVFRVKKLI